MRRGHPSIGGWRSENQRHFRPRGNGPPRFRPPRIYQLHDTPRFPPPNTRLNQRGPPPYNTHGGHPDDHVRQDHHDRHREYRDGHRQIDQRMPEREHHPRSRHMYQYNVHPNVRTKDNSNQCSSYKDPSKFYEDAPIDTFHVNSMGDIDHRQLPLLPIPADSFNLQRMSPWSNPPPNFKKHDYDDRSQNTFRPNDTPEKNKIPVVDYTGHRPPASDHYGGTSGPTTNNNDTSFSRSVHDTVDIVRKRLLNRNDPERLSQDAAVQPSLNEQEVSENANQHIQQEQPPKKRTPRQRQNIKSNCDKMKSNIVHQLFKMDKDKMHKLMDNPGSSSKFEYAISSLITESQNSLNRHLRSVAEKSLYSSSTDFIHNDNNTIYEDTFMKQMQCLLDPQDTVLLEDIKPIVMAELSKVLQLAEFDQRFEMPEDGQSNYPYFEPHSYDELSEEPCYVQEQPSSLNYENSNTSAATNNSNKNLNYNHETPCEEPNVLFERRQSKRIEQTQERKLSIDSRRNSQRRSSETPAEEPFKSKEEPLPLFDNYTDQPSEDEDTFAELDRQYHVAVDHNFIENDDLSRAPTNFEPAPQAPPQIKQEIDTQLQTIAQSPLDLFAASREALRNIAKHIKHEVTQSTHENINNETVAATEIPKTPDNDVHKEKHIKIKQEHMPQPKDTDKETDKAGSSNVIKTPPSNSRKRSTDQRPSHRKEKRKKSESSQSDLAKPTSEKNTPANVKTSSVKSSEKCNEAPKHYYTLYLPKDENKKEAKDSHKIDSTDKSYSDKYVKRKESSKKPKEKESDSSRRRHSSTSSQTILSPKDSINANSQTPTKTDPKIKLKTFDMFVEQPKKAAPLHQAHRNTATAVTPNKPATEDIISKQLPTPTPARKTLQVKTVGTQYIRRLITKETQTFQTKVTTTRFTQTERKKFVSKSIQTLSENLELERPKPRAADAFERMKEIDMEIQVLLQEKFKLYSSLESKESMPALGMTVLNVTPIDENKDEDEDHDTLHDNIMTADEIVEDFTSIPVEELEQIALESVQEDSSDSTKVEKRTLRQKVLQQERLSSESPTSRRSKKAKTPNISLIEQIITDDRPLEDIISLDALEEPQPAKSKKKPRSQPKKKPTKKTKPQKNANVNVNTFDIKDCSVVLIQTDVRKFIKEEPLDESDDVPMDAGPSNAEEIVTFEPQAKPALKPRQVVEVNVANDIQFDMLDVSEDIVIGEESEIKCTEKDVHGRVAISEEIILDNSQSSAEDASTAESGQAENECKMYDYSTDEKLRRDSVTITGNADAVLAIECIENDFIAACLDGNVYHFSGDGMLINTLRGSNLAVTCLTIVKEKYGTTVYTGSLDSRIRYYDLETGLEKGPECNVLSPIQTMDRAWDTVFVGTRTGFVLQFECKNNMLIPVSTVKFSEQSILALRAMKEGPRKVLLVAARSENVTIKDAQTGLLLRTLSGPKMTVYTLLFEDGKVFCGTSSHQIHVFDYASGTHTGCHEGGKGAVCLRATGGLLFAGCYDGCVYVYREGETRPLAQLRGPSLMLLSLAVVGSKIIAGYKDRSLYIWKIPLSILQEMIL
ncbi:hypothetical protein PYW07_008064 [Mythimna separata]|uniref:Zinc finger protein 106 n=1 Tax=Mythimna separata TaxID=271217 RepID=A0AAD8DUH8_MYTSE|nr:hypothetical protein PYW07_008064 [Mythimna separata]